MKPVFHRFSRFLESPFVAPLLLALIALLAYGQLLPQMGFYWDELPMSWIRYELGPQAMTRYFSSHRPVWGLLYQITTHILPQIPMDWQLFGLIWRWASSALVWAIIRDLWPGRRTFALIASLFFLLYPGFNQQWLSYLYSHFFIVLCFFLFSLLSMLRSLRDRHRYWLWTILALIFSAFNLWMMEYFFTLELVRPFIILCFVCTLTDEQNFIARLHLAVLNWVPYLSIFLAAVIWRLFVSNNPNYTPALIPRLLATPLSTIQTLTGAIFTSLSTVSLAAWGQIFNLPNVLQDGLLTIINYWETVLLIGLVLILSLAANIERRPKERVNLWPIGLGLIAMLAAGIPFWLTDLQVALAFPANRFTLPFMLGVTLLFAGVLELMPVYLRLSVATALIVFASGRQVLWANEFRQAWEAQKTFFWQMYWRAPGIQPNTLVLLNDNALQFYADNSLAGALNWIYTPTGSSSNSISYMLFFPTSRLGGSLPALQPAQPVTYDFSPGSFAGNTSQTLAFYYQSPACLHLLDPEIDTQNQFIPDRSLMRDAASLSSSAWITNVPNAHMPQIFGPEPPHSWCYYFEQADLARQMGDWQRVAQLGNEALQLGEVAFDPTERFVFIEGYAHTGNWQRMREQSNAAYEASPAYIGSLLCKLFERIDHEIPTNPEKEKRLNHFRERFSCPP